jgi:sugar-specific transcriptional regulator TrmB
MKYTPLFQKLGMSSAEATVYESLLALGEQPLTQLVKELGLPQTTVLQILERLEEMHLIAISVVRGRRRYQVLPPTRLANKLQKDRVVLADVAEELQGVLGELNQLYSLQPSTVPTTQLFVEEEVRQVLEDILATTMEPYRYIGTEHNLGAVLGERFLKQWTKRRVFSEIPSRTLVTKANGELDLNVHQPKLLRTTRFVEGGMFGAPQIIYGDNVASVISTDPLRVLVVTSREYAQTQRCLFDLVWQQAV